MINGVRAFFMRQIQRLLKKRGKRRKPLQHVDPMLLVELEPDHTANHQSSDRGIDLQKTFHDSRFPRILPQSILDPHNVSMKFLGRDSL